MKIVIFFKPGNEIKFMLQIPNICFNSLTPTDVIKGRYGNSSGRVRGGPAFWFENLTAEISKIVNKKNN